MASILIVEDSSFTRKIIHNIISEDGYEILEADNGNTGLEMIINHDPDCILVDLIMPEINGLEFLKTVREQGLSVPVIVITADIQDSTRERCLELGAAAFINKPVKEEELRNTLEGILSSTMENSR